MKRAYRGRRAAGCRLRIEHAGGLSRRFFLLLAASTYCANIGAQEETDNPAALDSFQVTATRGIREVRDISSAVTIVGENRILDEMPQVLPETLRGEVGAFFQQTTPGQGTVIVRGLKGSQVLHLVDGMRLNNAFFRSAPNQYLALVDSYNTERIEVVRGPAATLHGADAMGGVIQILTPEPKVYDKEWQYRGKVYAGLDSGDLAKVAHASFLAGRSGLAISGGASLQEFGNRQTGTGGRISPTGYRSEAGNLKFLLDVDSKSELMLSLQYLEQPETPRIDELVPGFDQTEPDSEQFFFIPNRREFYHGRYRLHPANDWLEKLEINLARQIITDDRLTQNFGSTEINKESNESALTGLTLQLDSSLSANTSLSYGFDYYTDEINSARVLTDTTSDTQQTAQSRFPDDSSMDSFSFYIFNEWRINPDWILSGGLRYSRFELELTDPNSRQIVNLRPDDLTGNFGLSYRITPTVNIVANLARGFRPPNIFDLGTLGSRPGNRFNIANTDLDSETVDSIDVGLKIQTQNWNIEAFAFYSDYQDRITSVATGGLTLDGRTIVRSENISEVDIYGVEFGARFAAMENLEAYAVLNYTRGEEEFPGGREQAADRIPPLNGKLGLRYTLRPEFYLEPYLLFADKQNRLSDRDINDPRINPNGTPGWATANINVNWRQSANLEWSLRLENLLDKTYREHGSGIDARGRSLSVALRSMF